MIKEGYRQFLLERAGTDKMRHSGRTLYEHLCGTHDLLEAWGNGEPVCGAGLFHSIYGTVRFRHKAWPLTDRNTIVKLIGPEAERLVYVFCIMSRPRIFLSAARNYGTDKVLRELLEIEAANLLEQGSKGHWLKDISNYDISEGAKDAINRYLKEAA